MIDDNRLSCALAHLYAAQCQFLDSDDAIIRDHVETAIFLLEGREEPRDIDTSDLGAA